jgi:DNA replication initiation complex subunit (GINS family)
MYDELYAAWRFELENKELGGLPPDFYGRASAFLKTICEEIRMFDKKTLKLSLLERELEHAEHMLQELIWTRYKKIVSFVNENQKLPSGLLADEEESLGGRFASFALSYQKFVGKLLKGQIPLQISKKPEKKVCK